MPKIQTNCHLCDKVIYRYTGKTKMYFCSVLCKDTFFKGKSFIELLGEEKAAEKSKILSERNSGEKNPNYGKKWDDQQKLAASIRQKEYLEDEDKRKKCGDSNRGKKFSPERIHKMHGNRSKESYSRPMSDETKKKLAITSSIRFTDDYKKKQREKMESLGHWAPLDEKPEYEIYFALSDWVHHMYSLVEVDNSIEDKVRDHIIPRWVGHKLRVFPEILRHPENCQIISRADNARKGNKDKKISLEVWEQRVHSLIDKILSYEKEWVEQLAAIESCRKFINKSKWENPHRKEESDVFHI